MPTLPNPPLPNNDGAAFFFDGDMGGVVCLHGFTGTPFEVRSVGEMLHAQFHLRVVAPLLPGHGTKPTDLNDVDGGDWERAASEAFQRLDDKKPRVIVGNSMGALLALRLAAAVDVDALILLAPAIEISVQAKVAGRLFRSGLARVVTTIDKEHSGGDVEDTEAREKNPTYPTMPTKAIATFNELRRTTRPYLSKVRSPTLICHGAKDGTALLLGSAKIARALKNIHVERVVFAQSRHLIGLDVDRGAVLATIERFVREQLATTQNRDESRV